MTDIHWTKLKDKKPQKSGEYQVRGRKGQHGIATYFTEHPKGRGWVIVGDWNGPILEWAPTN